MAVIAPPGISSQKTTAAPGVGEVPSVTAPLGLIGAYGGDRGGETYDVSGEGLPIPEKRFYESFEGSYASRNPNAYAAMRTLGDLIPFASFLFPSGRAEFGEKSIPGKIAHLGIETAAFIPIAWVGRGFKGLSMVPRLGIKGARKLKKVPGLELMDDLLIKFEGRGQAFVKKTPEGLLARKYNVPQTEIEAWKAGGTDTFFWRSQRPSEAFRNLLDQGAYKKGQIKFKEGVAKELAKVGKSREEQLLAWSKRKYDKAVKAVTGIDFLGKEFEEQGFKWAARQIYGDAARDWTLESLNPRIFGSIADHLLDNPGRFQAAADINFGRLWPSRPKPIRFVLGQGQRRFGTFSKVYRPLIEGYTGANSYAMRQIGLFGEILADKGLGKIKRLKTGETKFKLGVSKDDYYKAGEALVEIGEAAYKGVDPSDLRSLFLKQNHNVRQFVRAWYEFSDHLYLDHMAFKVPQLFGRAGLKGAGEIELERGLTRIVENLRRQFSPARDAALVGEEVGGLFKPGKRELVHQALEELKRMATGLSSKGYLDPKAVAGLLDDLTPGGKGFTDYLENYVTRIRGARAMTNKQIADRTFTGGGRLHAFYTKARRDPLGRDLSKNLGEVVEARVRAQSKELFFYPKVEEVTRFASQLPPQFKEYTGHYVFRLLGFPSPADLRTANFLSKTAGGAERLLGLGKGSWDEHRMMNLAYNLNNLAYMGGLGFKPFSALRNLFQPFTLVPADLGGAKDIGWFVKGIQRASKPSFRQFVRDDLKAIAEYAPEMHSRISAVAAGRRLKLPGGANIDLPAMQEVRDVGMFMFKMSDRWNRYVSAGAAQSKWEYYAAKFYNPKTQRMGVNFEKKMNISGRNEWIKDELRDLLRGGGEDNIRRARDLFTSDVIADTQFLYGITDSPIISHTLGAPGKMAMIFQSWWMNYASLMEKWLVTGDAPVKAGRLFNYMLTASIGYLLMEQIWGKGTAARTTFFGPLPSEVNEFLIPPTFDPVYHGLNAILKAPTDIDATRRHGRELLRSMAIFAPGGLQAKQTIRGIQEEGFPGFAKSIIRYSPPED